MQNILPPKFSALVVLGLVMFSIATESLIGDSENTIGGAARESVELNSIDPIIAYMNSDSNSLAIQDNLNKFIELLQTNSIFLSKIETFTFEFISTGAPGEKVYASNSKYGFYREIIASFNSSGLLSSKEFADGLRVVILEQGDYELRFHKNVKITSDVLNDTAANLLKDFIGQEKELSYNTINEQIIIDSAGLISSLLGVNFYDATNKLTLTMSIGLDQERQLKYLYINEVYTNTVLNMYVTENNGLREYSLVSPTNVDLAIGEHIGGIIEEIFIPALESELSAENNDLEGEINQLN